MSRRMRLVILAVLDGALGLLAQGPGRMPVRTFTAAEGLMGEQVNALIQDRHGRYWAAGLLGLHLGDGSTFVDIPLPQQERRPTLRSLAEAPDGSLYLEGARRLWRLEGDVWSLADEGLPPKGDAPTDRIVKDGTGQLWMSWGARIYRIEGPRRYVEIPVPGSGAVHLSARPHQAGLWACSEGKVWRWDGHDWAAMPPVPVQPEALLRGPAYEDGAGTLWAGGREHLFRLAPGAAAWAAVPDPDVNQGYATVLSSPSPGEVWAMGDQICRRLDASGSSFATTPAFSTYGLVLLLRDREGNLWADRNGLCRLGGPWRIHGGSDGLPSAGCWQALRDPLGRLWLCTTLGLFRTRPGGWEKVMDGTFQAQIALGADGYVWAIRRHTGQAVRFDARSPSTTPAPTLPFLRGLKGLRGIVSAGARVVLPILGDQVAIGTWSGREWRWKVLPAPFGEASFRTFSDRFGRFFILAWDHRGHLLASLDGGSWAPFPFPAENSVTDLWAVDPERMLVLQYSPAEVHELVWNGSAWSRLSVLPLDRFGPIQVGYALAATPEGHLWISTDQGVLELDRRDPTKVRRRTSLDALPMDDCNQYGLLLEKDRLWVSTGTGIACCDLARDPAPSPLPAPLVLASQTRGGQAWSLALPKELPSGASQLNLFIGLPSPERRPYLRYQWRDLDSSDAWQEFQGPQLTFLDPASGLHRVQVRCGLPGSASGLELAVPFRVLPPWWRRPWALALWCAVAAGLAWLLHRSRLRRIQARNDELAALVEQRTAALVSSEARQRQASQAKSGFLADMSHELRTPLNAILLYSELIHQDAQEAGSEPLAKDSGRILSAGRHLHSLINGILDLSKVEAGKMTLCWEHTELKLLLEEVAMTLAPLAREREDVLATDLADPDLAWETDPLKLKQVLINLASNAIKFTSAGHVTLRAQREGSHLRVDVEDSGVGMTPEQTARLFLAYEQPTQEGGYKAGGTGLGLTISRKYVELLGGTIEVRSVPGQGTTFLIRLPEGPEEGDLADRPIP